MTQILSFQKSCIDQKWYFRYPEYTGSHSDLEIVEGAEQLLTLLSDNLNLVQFHVSATAFEGASMIFKKLDETSDEKGANYQLYHNDYKTHQVWFCAVLEHLMGHFPDVIYAEPVELLDRIQDIQYSFFHAAQHFGIDSDMAKREWQLLEDTNHWVIWHAIALWTNYSREADIGWHFGDTQVLQFQGFQHFLGVDVLKHFGHPGLPERYLARTRNYPNELQLVVNDAFVDKAESFFRDFFKGEKSWVKIVPFSLVNWKEMEPRESEYYQEDIMREAEQITQWPMDEVDLWRRMAQRKDRFTLALLSEELDDDQKEQLRLLEEKLQIGSLSKMSKLWWDIAEFMKRKNQ